MYQADNAYDFKMILEDPSGGKFDDIVYRYSSPKRFKGTVYMQAKHKQLTGNVDTASDKPPLRESEFLAAWDSKSPFSIPMYFISFLDVEQRFPLDSKTRFNNDRKAPYCFSYGI
uniref:Uncharacterized protein n=1 Tax=Anopheles farauti TaxID=69004 RepID=A0A182QCH6_9DIPT